MLATAWPPDYSLAVAKTPRHTPLRQDLKLGLNDTTDEDLVSLKDLRMVFLWSRIRTVADYTDRSQVRLRHMLFEDFMEALVRLSSMIALPTDGDLSHTGCANAGQYIMMLRGEGHIAWDTFLEAR